MNPLSSNNPYIKINCDDGAEFVMHKDFIEISPTLKSLFLGGFAEQQTQQAKLQGISSTTFENFALLMHEEYMHRKSPSDINFHGNLAIRIAQINNIQKIADIYSTAIYLNVPTLENAAHKAMLIFFDRLLPQDLVDIKQTILEDGKKIGENLLKGMPPSEGIHPEQRSQFILFLFLEAYKRNDLITIKELVDDFFLTKQFMVFPSLPPGLKALIADVIIEKLFHNRGLNPRQGITFVNQYMQNLPVQYHLRPLGMLQKDQFYIPSPIHQNLGIEQLRKIQTLNHIPFLGFTFAKELKLNEGERFKFFEYHFPPEARGCILILQLKMNGCLKRQEYELALNYLKEIIQRIGEDKQFIVYQPASQEEIDIPKQELFELKQNLGSYFKSDLWNQISYKIRHYELTLTSFNTEDALEQILAFKRHVFLNNLLAIFNFIILNGDIATLLIVAERAAKELLPTLHLSKCFLDSDVDFKGSKVQVLSIIRNGTQNETKKKVEELIQIYPHWSYLHELFDKLSKVSTKDDLMLLEENPTPTGYGKDDEQAIKEAFDYLLNGQISEANKCIEYLLTNVDMPISVLSHKIAEEKNKELAITLMSCCNDNKLFVFKKIIKHLLHLGEGRLALELLIETKQVYNLDNTTVEALQYKTCSLLLDQNQIEPVFPFVKLPETIEIEILPKKNLEHFGHFLQKLVHHKVVGAINLIHLQDNWESAIDDNIIMFLPALREIALQKGAAGAIEVIKKHHSEEDEVFIAMVKELMRSDISWSLQDLEQFFTLWKSANALHKGDDEDIDLNLILTLLTIFYSRHGDTVKAFEAFSLLDKEYSQGVYFDEYTAAIFDLVVALVKKNESPRADQLIKEKLSAHGPLYLFSGNLDYPVELILKKLARGGDVTTLLNVLKLEALTPIRSQIVAIVIETLRFHFLYNEITYFLAFCELNISDMNSVYLARGERLNRRKMEMTQNPDKRKKLEDNE